MTEYRAIWLTYEQRDALAYLTRHPGCDPLKEVLLSVPAAWDASPADADAAIQDACDFQNDVNWFAGEISDAILAALKHPDHQDA